MKIEERANCELNYMRKAEKEKRKKKRRGKSDREIYKRKKELRKLALVVSCEVVGR